VILVELQRGWWVEENGLSSRGCEVDTLAQGGQVLTDLFVYDVLWGVTHQSRDGLAADQHREASAVRDVSAM
jgi:hypothetical protein